MIRLVKLLIIGICFSMQAQNTHQDSNFIQERFSNLKIPYYNLDLEYALSHSEFYFYQNETIYPGDTIVVLFSLNSFIDTSIKLVSTSLINFKSSFIVRNNQLIIVGNGPSLCCLNCPSIKNNLPQSPKKVTLDYRLSGFIQMNRRTFHKFNGCNLIPLTSVSFSSQLVKANPILINKEFYLSNLYPATYTTDLMRKIDVRSQNLVPSIQNYNFKPTTFTIRINETKDGFLEIKTFN